MRRPKPLPLPLPAVPVELDVFSPDGHRACRIWWEGAPCA
jgi:hypothetical protein